MPTFFNSHDLIEHYPGTTGGSRTAARKRDNTARGIHYQRVESAQSYCAVKRLSCALNRGIWWTHRSGSAPGTALAWSLADTRRDSPFSPGGYAGICPRCASRASYSNRDAPLTIRGRRSASRWRKSCETERRPLPLA